MKRHALHRGYRLTSIARRFREIDFENFDYMIAMDGANYSDLHKFDSETKYSNKIFKMTDFEQHGNYKEVPDPYYGGPEGFEIVFILEDSCSGLLQKVEDIIPLGGGDIGNAMKVTVENGTNYFVKQYENSKMHYAEANGLHELKTANAIRIPRVIKVNDNFLILEFIESASKVNDFDEKIWKTVY